MAKQRQSNIELCRLASILLVMLVHSVGKSLGDDVALGAYLLKGFSIIGVNVFILITGYFSATPKKTSLINLAFICFFWMFFKVGARYLFGEEIGIKDFFFLTSANWFIASYIGLLFLAPILNSFCNSVSKQTLWLGGAFLIIIEVWFDLLPPHPKVSLGTQRGYSVYSFMTLYLLARAIKLYGLPKIFKKLCPYIYVICSFFLGFAAYVCQITHHNETIKIVFAYNNPIVILSSVAFLMTFEKMTMHSTFINHISKSTLACLLGHTSVVFLYTRQYKYLYDHYAGFELVGYWIMATVIVFVASIAIDQLRLLIYNPIGSYLKNHIKQDEILKRTSN